MNVYKEFFGKEQRLISYASSNDRIVKRFLINTVELLTGRKRVERIYAALKKLNAEGLYIWDYIFELLEINLSFDENNLSLIPSEGPLLIISNHPFGVADGLALGYLLSRRRDDFYIIVNKVLCREQILGEYFLPIDFADTREAIKVNLNTRMKSIDFLQRRGAVAIFPSGGVATAPRVFARAVDLEWKNFLIKIIRKTSAIIIPVFFEGQNSSLFQFASHINMNLRLGLLLNELNNKKNKTISLRIGRSIDRSVLEGMTPAETISYLKATTMNLRETSG